MKKLFGLLAVILIVSGCATFTPQQYSISVDNNAALRSLNGMTVNVGPFTSAPSIKNEVMCRGAGPISTPDKNPFSEYIRKALIDELKVANAFSATAPATITGKLEAIDFSSMEGRWNIKLTLNSSNGKSMAVTENYSYETSFEGVRACEQTAKSLMPAVQSLIGRLARSQEFAALVSP
ncbi:MAG: hypothetical protein HY892_08290 [Deltaproteobacteria bacterium]|nr:hypothetical protein [Deltaproteobacteria bacterium]